MSMTARSKFQVMTLTDAAAARVREIVAGSDNPDAALRLGVKKGGCAGMEYTMAFVTGPEPGDEVVHDKGVTVLIDAKAVLFLLGTQMDYSVETLSARFVFNNPNQTSACGCGESVQLTPAQLSGDEKPAH